MRIFKIVGIVVLLIVVIALIVAAIIKKDYVVERSATINKPVTEVFDYVKYLKNQNEYSVWAKIDPTMKKEYKGEDAKPGFVSSWDSKNDDAGAGEQEIKSISPNEKINYEIRFIRPFKSTSNAKLELNALDSSSTKITWIFEGNMKYPTNIMLLVMDMEKMIGKDLEGGLSNLKSILEK